MAGACGRQKKTHEASLVPAAPEDVGSSFQGTRCLENSLNRMFNTEQESPGVTESRFKLSSGQPHKEVTWNAPHARQKVEKTFSTMNLAQLQPLAFSRGIHADSLWAWPPASQVASHFQKTPIHQLLGPTHNFTHR